MPTTLSATLPDRRSVELAIEHLVQDYGLDRSAIEISPVGRENTAGEQVAGADAESGYPTLPSDPQEAAINGAIQVTVTLDEAVVDKARAAFEEAGATNIAASAAG